MPSITLAHVIDDVFELVSRGASSADVIPGHEVYPDLYPVWSPAELGEALIRARRKVDGTTTLTGQGHTARTVGGDRLAASVLLAD